MVKVRQDAWSHEDDLLLAETVLRHIREGSTQLKAFDEVGDKLNRTSAACGFRWNAEIRQKYVSAIDMAKRQRKEKKRAMAQMDKQSVTEKVAAVSSTSTMQPSTSFSFEFGAEQTSVHTAPSTNELDLESVIGYLQNLQKEGIPSVKSAVQIEKLVQDKEQMANELKNMEQELAETKQKLATVQEDYNTFISLMDRARKLSLPEEDNIPATSFQQSRNPSLEQLIQNSN
ncbi:RsfA family transcriptional regulator [Aciduricibacillus chroicocephali]|uniref:RsfA family transcriptional regulator n=1 Tax=Aciduricibacillus chroicocephali TaxID=3054939 RepID=A0ABY9KTR0_9BACI|nr:RsfA family transcriptional regulator [Bacillaceae bacterium 44XB]